MTNVCSRETRRSRRAARGEVLAVGELDVENQERHGDGEDAVGKRFDTRRPETSTGRNPGTGTLPSHRRAPPTTAGAGPNRATNAAGAISAPSISSERTSSVPPPPQCARRRPSRASSAGAGWGRRRSMRRLATRALEAADRRQGARIRRRHRADEVVNRNGVAVPVNRAVRRAAPAKVAALGEILGEARRRAGNERGQHAIERHFRGDGHLVEDLAGSIVGKDRHRGLRDDIAGVRLLGHVVERRASLAFAAEPAQFTGAAAVAGRSEPCMLSAPRDAARRSDGFNIIR